jgi:prevent-host-death family protein
MRFNIREFKINTYKVLEHLKDGEITITRYGKPVFKLVPIDNRDPLEDFKSDVLFRLEELEKKVSRFEEKSY